MDFCVAPHSSRDWIGPILASNGHLTGLPYGNATKYFDVPAEQLDVRLVPPGGSDCDTALGGLPDFTNLPALPADASATIAAEGLVAFASTTPIALRAYIDDVTVVPNKTKLRFVHASPGTGPVDLGTGGGALFASLFSDVAYGDAAAGGYLTFDLGAATEISARPHGTLSDALSITPVSLPDDAIITAFAIGIPGNSATPLRAMLCTDSDPPKGLLTPCTIVGGAPERIHVRVAHLSPDTPPVDVCIAEIGTSYGQPLFKSLGMMNGLAYPQVTAYLDLPTMAYNVRVVQATASGCSVGALPDFTFAGRNDSTQTVAAIGVLDATGAAASNPHLELAAFTDDTAVDTGKTKVRFIHASPGTPQVDVGLEGSGGFTTVFSSVFFGTTANAYENDNGFVETMPVTSNVAARVSGTTTDALMIPNVTLGANAISTAIAIGGKTGASTNPLQVLLCADNAPANGLFAACAVAP